MGSTEAIGYLQKQSTTSGDSVYDHLTRVVSRVLHERPNDAVDVLETSMLVKNQAHANGNENLQLQQRRGAQWDVSEQHKAQGVAKAELFKAPAAPAHDDETDDAIHQAPAEFTADDISTHATLLKAVGAGIGEDEAYEVALAMQRLGENADNGIESARFFGKVLGTQHDYYVFECTVSDYGDEPAAPEDASAPPVEHASGPNAYVYFVCNRPGGPMKRLPEVTPEQIRYARQLKQHFTGRLDAPVNSMVPFPGTEAELLRAQIARIAAATVLAPAGFYEHNEDDEVQQSEDFAYSNFSHSDFARLDSWVHQRPPLLGQGRSALHEPPEPEEDEEPQELPEGHRNVVEGGESELAPAADDLPIDEDEGIPQWAPLKSTRVPGMQHGVGGIRSLLWPGAYAVGSQSTFANIYIGFGMINSRFKPPMPPPVQKEYNDAHLKEQTDLPPPPKPPEPEEGDENEEDESDEDEDAGDD